MGLVRDLLKGGVDFVKEEILPLRDDLLKAGIITPEKGAYDQKASLADPWAYSNTAYGYKEKYSILDYAKCRQITYADPVVAAVIQTRINQVAGFARIQSDKYKMGYKVVLRDDEKEPTDKDKKRIRELETFLQACGVPENFEDTPDLKRRDNFESFLRKVTRDSLTFDQVNFEVVPRQDGKPYSFHAIDAATIRVIPDKKEEVEKYGNNSGKSYDPKSQYMPFERNTPFKEFNPKSPKFAQVIQGAVRHVFDEWEMAFGVRNPRTDIASYGYGFSEIEMLVTTITSHMNAETYNRKFFSQGSAIKGVLAFEGAVPPDQLEAFRRQWHQQVTGVNNAWRTPIMSLGKDSKLNWTNLHSNNREMEFGKWMEYCIKTICGVFQIDPIEIGFDISKMGSGQGGGSGGGLGQGNQAERYGFSQDKGLRPLLVFLQTLINDYVIYRIDPNYEFQFVGLNVNSEKDDLDKAVQQVKAFKTVNEIRAEHDLEEIDMEKIKKNPGELILDSSFIQFITGQIQAEAAAQQPGMDAAGGGAPEAPPDGGQEPDYENMSLEELQGELGKLQGGDTKEASGPEQGQAEGSAPAPAGKKPAPAQAAAPTMKSFFRELEL